jgi:hypothetical protein
MFVNLVDAPLNKPAKQLRETITVGLLKSARIIRSNYAALFRTYHCRSQSTHCRPGGNDMSEASRPSDSALQTNLVEQYLSLEAMEVIEELLELCGANIDVRALPRLRQRLAEEESHITVFQARGYVRMREKSEQLVRSLQPLIVILENAECARKRSDQ